VDVVVVADLRDLPLDSSVDISELQRDAVASMSGAISVGRVLIVDDVANVAKRGEAIDRILTSPSTRSVVVLLTGEPQEPGVVAEVPAALIDRPNVVMLWVGDTRGIQWQANRRTAATLVNDPEDPQGDGHWQALFDAMLIPTVFDRVAESIKAGRSSCASPGIALVRASAGALGPALSGLVEGAVRALAADPVSAFQETKPASLEPLLGTARPAIQPLSPDGQLHRERGQARQALDTAEQALADLQVRPVGVVGFGPALERVHALGAALTALGRSAAETIGGVEPRDGIDLPEAELLQRAGVDLSGSESAEMLARDASDDLRSAALSHLATTGSLTATEQVLRHLAAQARPADATTIRNMLSRAGLVTVGKRLSEVGNTPVHVPPVALLFWIAIGALGVVDRHLFTMVMVVLGVIAGTAATLAFAGRQSGTPRREEGTSVILRRAGVLSSVGSLVAVVTPLSTGFPGRTVAAILAFVLAGTVVQLVRRETYNRWRTQVELTEARAALDRFDRVVAQVVTNDLVLANCRNALGALAERFADVLSSLATSCRRMVLAEGEPSMSRTGGSSVQRELIESELGLARHLGAIQRTIKADCVHIAGLCLEKNWGALYVGNAHADVDADLRANLRSYGEHTQTYGPFFVTNASPSFEANRRQLLRDMWSASSTLAEILASDSNSELLQLCSPGHLVLLDVDAPHRIVRFAPELARESANVDQVNEVAWTQDAVTAGVVRLVSVNAGALRPVR